MNSNLENTRWSTWQGETRGPELTFNSLFSARAYNCCLHYTTPTNARFQLLGSCLWFERLTTEIWDLMVPMVYKTVVKEKFITQWRHVVLGRLPDSDLKVETDESFRRCSPDAMDKILNNVTSLRSLALQVCFLQLVCLRALHRWTLYYNFL